MKIDLFYELQKPKPWEPDHEWTLFKETLCQARLADEVGFDCWWEVEHHTVEEFTYSSAPEVVLAAISQNTKRLRLGHAVVLAPFNFNHPIRVAERAATLDLISDGRLEFGMGRSTALEWWIFGIDPEDTRNQMQEALQMIPKMWSQDRFRWDSKYFKIPERPIIPKPYQKPHPPMWMAASSPASVEMAAHCGIGMLGLTLLRPLEDMAQWLDTYRREIKHAEPVGSFINNQTGVFTFVHCAETTREAIEHGAAEAAAWYINSFPVFLNVPAQEGAPTGQQLEAGQVFRAAAGPSPDQPREELTPVMDLLSRIREGEQISGEEIFEILNDEDMVIIGDPETCKKKMKRYREIGVDRLLCLSQVGRLPHDAVMDSIRLVGRHLIPYFSPK